MYIVAEILEGKLMSNLRSYEPFLLQLSDFGMNYTFNQNFHFLLIALNERLSY